MVTGSGPLRATVTGLEAFRTQLEEASAGEDIGAQLEGVTLDHLEDASELTVC